MEFRWPDRAEFYTGVPLATAVILLVVSGGIAKLEHELRALPNGATWVDSFMSDLESHPLLAANAPDAYPCPPRSTM